MEKALTIADQPLEVGSTAAPSFAEAVLEHQSMVFSIACHLLRNASLAEETAQDVFLRLYRDYHRIASGEHLVQWLRRTTTHRCLDLLRSSQWRRQVPLEELPLALSPAATDTDPILAERLRRLVADLPALARAVVVLRYQEDLEPREIAQLLELPVNTVKSRLQRALNLLRDRLSQPTKESRHAPHRG